MAQAAPAGLLYAPRFRVVAGLSLPRLAARLVLPANRHLYAESCACSASPRAISQLGGLRARRNQPDEVAPVFAGGRRFVDDSLLEGSGFELSVPRGDGLRSQAPPTVTSVPRPLASAATPGHDAGPDDMSRRAASTARRRATAAGGILEMETRVLRLRGLRGALSTSSIRCRDGAHTLQ